jgi:large subunit ribosomal protein L21e
LLKKKFREAGKVGLSRLLYDYNINEKVKVIIDPAIHKGMPHRRYHGLVGDILGKRGRSYVIGVPIKGSVKSIIIRPEHLRPLGG